MKQRIRSKSFLCVCVVRVCVPVCVNLSYTLHWSLVSKNTVSKLCQLLACQVYDLKKRERKVSGSGVFPTTASPSQPHITTHSLTRIIPVTGSWSRRVSLRVHEIFMCLRGAGQASLLVETLPVFIHLCLAGQTQRCWTSQSRPDAVGGADNWTPLTRLAVMSHVRQVFTWARNECWLIVSTNCWAGRVFGRYHPSGWHHWSCCVDTILRVFHY